VRTDNPYNPDKARTVANNERQTTLTPAAAAQRLGIEVYTVRRWCDWHAAYLSPGASPGPGALRRLTQRDVEVLSQVRELRAQGLHTETINEQLAGLTFAVVDTDEQSAADSEAIITTTAQEAPQAIVVALQAMQRQIDALQQANQPANSRRFDTITVLGIGICIGLLFAVGMIVLAWLYGGG